MSDTQALVLAAFLAGIASGGILALLFVAWAVLREIGKS